jgi:hypothetical protein
VRIVGVDREHPAAKRMAQEFQEHAVSPEEVARRIVKGVERGTYLVYTSRDIRLAHLLQRVAPPAYRLAMRALQRRLGRVAELAAAPVAREAPRERAPH